MKIGVFDSGIGGLSVLRALRAALPEADLIYYADQKNVPYGEKSRDEIIKYSFDAVSFLVRAGAEAVVIACNTATSAAVASLRAVYETNVPMIPIIGMEPAVKRALEHCGGGRVLTAATPLTVKGKKLGELIERYDKEHLTDLLPLPGLVRLAEGGIFDGEEADRYIAHELAAFELSKYSALVLGCTHFNYFKACLRRHLPTGVRIVDGVDGTVRRLISRLPRLDGGGGTTAFYISGEKVIDSAEFERYIAHLDRMAEIE